MDTVSEYAAKVRNEIAAVLAVHGHEAGQYSVLGPDPWQVVWNEDRSGFVPFLEGCRCLLAWRSPVASVDGQPELWARLVDHAEHVGKPLFALEVNETTRAAGVKLGMVPIWVGTESFLELSTWSINGGQRQHLRRDRSHAAKFNMHWREAFPLTVSSDEVGIQHIEQLWKAERPERRTDSFLRTSFAELADLRRYFVCEGPDGFTAFVTCTPVSREGWYLQDLVRSPDAPRGALEGAMVLALEIFRDEGFTFASNGPLPFWRPNGTWSDPHQLGVIGNHVMKLFDRRYRFRGINQFRSKFEPDLVIPLYFLRTRRIITPSVVRSLIKLLKERVT